MDRYLKIEIHLEGYDSRYQEKYYLHNKSLITELYLGVNKKLLFIECLYYLKNIISFKTDILYKTGKGYIKNFKYYLYEK
jgi:hypothetical protein